MSVDHLVLIPTEREKNILLARAPDLESSRSHVATCGFGPVVAAAKATRLILQLQPKKVWLLGIAGRFGDQLEIGKAYFFSAVTIYGIGFGEGDEFCILDEGQLDPAAVSTPNRFALDRDSPDAAGELLTVTASSASKIDVSRRLRNFPQAVAEDMEGYGVALACHISGVPLSIIRGISNDCGNRNHREWEVESSLAEVAEVFKSAPGF